MTEDAADWPLGRLLATVARHVEHDWNAWLAGRGLTHAGLLVLHHLDHGSASQRQLAAACQVEEQTMARTLERLQRTGHVRRERDPIDRRRVQVRRSELGDEVWREVSRTRADHDLVAAPLADPEAFRAELLRLLDARGRPPDREPPSDHPDGRD